MRPVHYLLGLTLSPVACFAGFGVFFTANSDACAEPWGLKCTGAAEAFGQLLFYGGGITFIAVALHGLYRLALLARDHAPRP